MDRGIRLQKEIAMGLKGAQKEASGKYPGAKKAAKKPAAALCSGGMVKKGKK
jgi:hypothetical protein